MTAYRSPTPSVKVQRKQAKRQRRVQRRERQTRRSNRRLRKAYGAKTAFPGLSGYAEYTAYKATHPAKRPLASPYPGLAAEARRSTPSTLRRSPYPGLSTQTRKRLDQRTRSQAAAARQGTGPKRRAEAKARAARRKVYPGIGAGEIVPQAAGFKGTDIDIQKPALSVLSEATRVGDTISGSISGHVHNIKRISQGKAPKLDEPFKRAVASGITRKKIRTYDDVIREAGGQKALSTVLGKQKAKTIVESVGLAADIGLDPTTYLMLGATAPGKIAARAAARAAKKAAPREVVRTAPSTARGATRGAKQEAAEEIRLPAGRGRTPAQRKAMRRQRSRASRQAYTRERARVGKGVEVRTPLGKVRTGGRLTGRAGKQLGTLTRPARQTRPARKLGQAASRTARGAFPLRPKGFSDQEWERFASAEAERRGQIMAGSRRAASRGRAITKELGGRTRGRVKPAPVHVSQKVRDAIEAQDLSTLNPKEKRAAQALVREQEISYQRRRQTALARGEKPPTRYKAEGPEQAKGYVSRVVPEVLAGPERTGLREYAQRGGQVFDEDALPARAKRTLSSVKTAVPKDYRREAYGRRPMSEIRDEDPTAYVEDLDTTFRVVEQKNLTGEGNQVFRESVKGLGRPLRQRDVARNRLIRGPDEAIYTVKEVQGVRKLVEASKAEVATAAKQAGRPGMKGGSLRDFVVLKKEIADHANEATERASYIPFLDVVTNKIKWVLTVPNPQYWARNLYGGMFNAWLEGVHARRLPGDVRRSAKVAAQISRRSRQAETLTPRRLVSRSRVGRLGRKPVKLERLGQRKIPMPFGKRREVTVDQLVRDAERYNVSGGGLTQELLRASSARRMKAQTFEDIPRLAAFIHYQRRGLSPQEAARRARVGQFDYGALSTFEKNWARRIFPFYTWKSRNIAFQGKTLVTRPGKYANFERVRQQAADWVGLPDDWQDKLSQSEALGVPLPTPFKRGGKTELLFPGLPVTELNLVTKNPNQAIQLLTSSVHPGAKAFVEFLTNYSFYFQDVREAEGRRFTDAPQPLVEAMGKWKPLQNWFEKKNIIKRHADGHWLWRKDAQFVADLTPLTSTLSAAMIGTEAGRKTVRGSTTTEKAIGYGTGLRPKSFDPPRAKLGKVWDEWNEVQLLLGDETEAEKHKDAQGRYTPTYARLKTRENQLAFERARLQKQLGEPVTETPTKEPKVYPPGYNPDKPSETGGTTAAPTGGGKPWWESGGAVRPAAPAPSGPTSKKKPWWE